MSEIKDLVVLTLFCICFYTCNHEAAGPVANDIIEPEMVLIDKDLQMKRGPSWEPGIRDILTNVTLDTFEIGKYELTNLQFSQFVQDGGYSNSKWWSEKGWKTRTDSSWTRPKYWGEGNNPWESDPFSNKTDTPVHGICYYEADAYCKWLSTKTTKNYYIPSSDQWERAAKGPDPGIKYTWGNEFNEANAYYLHPISPNTHLMPVTSNPGGKSHDGCFNMIGNAYEICDRIPDEWGDFVLIHSYHQGICSEPNCMKETMTTVNGGAIERDERRYAVGVRICRNK